jgi:hypothetical protein
MASQEVIVTVKLDTATKAFLTDLSKRHAEHVAPRPARLVTGGVVVPIQLQATAEQELNKIKTELACLKAELIEMATDIETGPEGPTAIAYRLRRLALAR